MLAQLTHCCLINTKLTDNYTLTCDTNHERRSVLKKTFTKSCKNEAKNNCKIVDFGKTCVYVGRGITPISFLTKFRSDAMLPTRELTSFPEPRKYLISYTLSRIEWLIRCSIFRRFLNKSSRWQLLRNRNKPVPNHSMISGNARLRHCVAY